MVEAQRQADPSPGSQHPIETPAQTAPPRSRRRLWVLGAALLIGLFFIGPWLAAIWAREKLVAVLEQELECRASLEDISLNWVGRANLRNLRLEHLDGRPFAALGQVEARISLPDLFRGDTRFEATVDAFELWARHTEDGGWDLTQLKREKGDDEDDDSGGSSRTGAEDGALLGGHLELLNGRLRIERADQSVLVEQVFGSVRFEQIEGQSLMVEVDRLELAATDEADREANREAARGGFRLLDTRVRLLETDAGWAVRDLELELGASGFPLSVANLLLDHDDLVSTIRGTVEGNGSVVLTGPRLVGGSGEWVFSGLELGGPRAPALLPETKLTWNAQAEGDGAADVAESARQVFRLEADRILELVFEGHATHVAETLHQTGTLQVGGSLDGLAHVAQAWIPLKQELSFDGRLEGSLALDGTHGREGFGRLGVSGELGLRELQARTEAGQDIDLQDLANVSVALSGALEPARGEIAVDDLHVDGGPLQLEGNLTLLGLPTREQPEMRLAIGDSELVFTADLARWTETLERLLDQQKVRVQGTARATLKAQGDADGGTLHLQAEADDLHAYGGALKAGSLSSKHATLEANTSYSTDADVLTIESLHISSDPLVATLSGALGGLTASSAEDGAPEGRRELDLRPLRGSGHYVPDALAPLVDTWLPGKLSGQEPESFEFELNGPLRSQSWISILAEGKGKADIQLALFETERVDLRGLLEVEVDEAQTNWKGRLKANGGDLGMSAVLSVDGSTDTTLSLRGGSIRADQRLAPLLSYLHPALGSSSVGENGLLRGLIDLELDLRLAGTPLPELLDAGLSTLPLALMSGSGKLHLRGVSLRGAPAIRRLFDSIGLKSDDIELAPLSFEVRDGHVSYSEPWPWIIDGIATNFTGSIGFDRTADLAWRVPITAELIDKVKELAPLRGQAVEIGLEGPIDDLDVVWATSLETLLKDAVLDQVTSGLGLGEKDSGNPNDPGWLLKEADRLWDAGEKLAAAELYGRIREEFKISIVYLLNRDRIKRRGRYEED